MKVVRTVLRGGGRLYIKPIPLPDSKTPMCQFDVFISHASEDKDNVVRPLAEALRRAGLRVWLDEFELKLGVASARRLTLDCVVAVTAWSY